MPPRRSSARQGAGPPAPAANPVPISTREDGVEASRNNSQSGGADTEENLLEPSKRARQSSRSAMAPGTLTEQNPDEGSIAPPLLVKKPSRFKPRATPRQNQHERERLEQVEKDRLAQAVAKKVAEEQRAARNRGGRPLGRGAGKLAPTRGRGGGVFYGKEAGRSSGPFGGGYILNKSRGVTRATAEEVISGDHGLGGVSMQDVKDDSDIPTIKRHDSGPAIGKRPSTAKSRSTKDSKIKHESEDPAFISSDDDNDRVHGERINIEYINLDSDDEQAEASHSTLRPIFVERQEHVDRSIDVNAQSSLARAAEIKRKAEERADEVQQDSIFFSDDESGSPERRRVRKSKDFEVLGSHRRWRGMYDDDNSESVVIKEEPRSDDDAPTSPKSTNATSIDGGSDDEPHIKKEKNIPKRRKILDLDNPRLWKQTREGAEEWDRIQQAKELVKAQLTDPRIVYKPQERQNTDASATNAQNSGLSYLFQFPPVLPQLRLPQESVTEGDVRMTDAHETEDVTESRSTIGTTPLTQQPTNSPSLFQSPMLRNPAQEYPSGKVGKLVVHESGAAYLHWGTGPDASILELRNGHALSFRMDLVMAEKGFADKKAAVAEKERIKEEAEEEERKLLKIPRMREGENGAIVEVDETRDDDGDDDVNMEREHEYEAATVESREEASAFEEVFLGGATQTLRRGGACSLGPIAGRFTLMPDWERLLGAL